LSGELLEWRSRGLTSRDERQIVNRRSATPVELSWFTLSDAGRSVDGHLTEDGRDNGRKGGNGSDEPHVYFMNECVGFAGR